MNTRNPQFDDDSGHEPPGDDIQAAEYVLGVLDAGQRHSAQERIAAEPAFAQLVAGWEQRFENLLSQIEPVAAPAHLWPRIRTALGWSPVESTRRGLWQNVGFWRGATAATFAAAAALAVVFVMRAPRPIVILPTAPVPTIARAVTTLAHDDGSPAYLATIDTQQGRVELTPVPGVPDAQGRVPELWLIPAGEAPRSLGIITVDKARSIDVPNELRRALVIGTVLAVTLEPPGGAPQGTPTGPIIAKGGIQAI